jgi:hypothetical protein
MRRGGLRITILLAGAALPFLLATTAAVGAPALPGVPVTVPTVTAPSVTVPAAPAGPTVTVPTIPTVTVPSVPVPQLPTMTVPTIPTVTVPPVPTVTVPTLPTTDVAPSKLGAAGTVAGTEPAAPTDASSTTSSGTATDRSPASTGTDAARTTATRARPAAHRPPTLLGATRQAAAPFALPLAAMLLLAAWMVVRGMHDRRDVRLAAAPVADRWIGFR